MDLESRARADDPQAIRLWLRMMACAATVEREERRRLRAEFDTTPPRFGLMAQLHRSPVGLSMGELSQRLMVTGGNVTGIAEQLVKEGMVAREADPHDRRAYRLSLTLKGRRQFSRMAAAHEKWTIELFSALSDEETAQTYALLGKLKAGLARQETKGGDKG